MFCSEGEEVDLEYDSEKNKYLVTSCSSEIGYIPESKTSYISDLENDGYFPLGEIQETGMSDSGKYYVIIEVSFA